MTTQSGDQIRPFYAEARALFPLLPEDIVVMPDADSGEAFFHGLTPEGWPRFQGTVNYTIPQKTGHHESGHAFKAMLSYWDSATDWQALYWSFRGFPGTWQQALAESQKQTSFNAAWIWDPNESWAEAFANAVAGVFVGEKTLDYGKTIDPMSMRAFFQGLQGEAKPVVIPPTTVDPLPTPEEVPVYVQVGPTPNRWVGALRKVNYVVIHTTEGSAGGSRSWGLNPASQAGWHYMVLVDGTVEQFCLETDAAWHAGKVSNCQPPSSLITLPNPNLEAIGIEFVGFHNQRLVDAQIESGANLIRDIRSRHGQVPTVKHSEIDTCNRRDPGQENYTRLLVALKEEEDLDEVTVRRIANEEIAKYGSRLQPELVTDRKRIDALEQTTTFLDRHTHATTIPRPPDSA